MIEHHDAFEALGAVAIVAAMVGVGFRRPADRASWPAAGCRS
jgi:hypothetical protein